MYFWQTQTNNIQTLKHIMAPGLNTIQTDYFEQNVTPF